MNGSSVARRLTLGVISGPSLPSPVASGGRIDFDRWSGGGIPTGTRKQLLADPDGSHVAPSLAQHPDVEVGQPSPDGSLMSIVEPNAQGLVVGRTVRTDGSQHRRFADLDPTLNLAWTP